MQILASRTLPLLDTMTGKNDAPEAGGDRDASALSGGTRNAVSDALSREVQDRFVADNMRRIFRQIYRLVGNIHDAQDLTQETFIKALQRQEQLKDLDKTADWLSVIATNKAIDF